MDGEGDLGMHHTSSVFADGRLRCLHLSDAPGTSTGFFYMDVTELLGFRPLRHDGKARSSVLPRSATRSRSTTHSSARDRGRHQQEPERPPRPH
jgi:predicted NodU family carbamoyl transferase